MQTLRRIGSRDVFGEVVRVVPAMCGNRTGGSPTVGGSAGVVSTSAAKLVPAKPFAGKAVSAIVLVKRDGAPVTPTSVTCTASIGAARLKGTPPARLGRAICVYRAPRAAKGKLIKGAVSLRVRGERFTKTFSARLG